MKDNATNTAFDTSHVGQRVLVTGGGAGIGRAIALGFARCGAEITIADWSAEQAEAVAREIDALDAPKAVAIAVDVSDYTAFEAGLKAHASSGTDFDVLINNAAISPKHEGRAHAIWEMAPSEWQQVVGVNLNGTFNAIRLVACGMRERRKGAIVNMSSVAGRTHSPIVASHYAATKAAIIGFTKHLAAELGPHNVRVNAMAPGRIDTPMVRGVNPAINDEQIAMTPMGRLGQPEEVAELALYLVSERSSFITGQTIDVAGGLYMT